MATKKRRGPGRPPLPASERSQAIAIRIHPQVLKELRQRAEDLGIGYQTLINTLLRRAVL